MLSFVHKGCEREQTHCKRLCAVYYLLGKSMTQKAHLSPGGETVVKRTVNTPTDGTADNSFAGKNGDWHEWCKLGVRSRFREAESLCVHLDDLYQ
jgi:hypothetical protein